MDEQDRLGLCLHTSLLFSLPDLTVLIFDAVLKLFRLMVLGDVVIQAEVILMGAAQISCLPHDNYGPASNNFCPHLPGRTTTGFAVVLWMGEW